MKLKMMVYLSLVYASLGFADDIKLMGTISKSIEPRASHSFRANTVTNNHKKMQIGLMAIKLSPKAQAELANRLHHPSTEGMSQLNTGRGSIQLGMNGVPILNQGAHGACVTFAVTAAVEAALNLNDEISQVCHLALGNYLEDQGYTTSGWDGTFAHSVLNQIETFGIISKRLQQTQGCGGLYDYPVDTFDTPSEKMSIEGFHQLSESLNNGNPLSYPLLHMAQSFSRPINTQKILASVKEALNRGDRVVFGTLLADIDLGLAGAVGNYKVPNDTWVLTPAIRTDLTGAVDLAGHEMIITGYNDNAIAHDEEGKTYRGLLTLRNSWGEHVGNEGEFYMSYDYFTMLVIEAHIILSAPVDDSSGS